MKTVRLTIFLFLVLIVPFVPDASAAQSDNETLRRAVEDSVKAEGRRLDDFTLTDQDGTRFQLSEYFKTGKPLVVSFVYTSCPDVCPAVSSEFKKAVDEARRRFGIRFNVLTIGFDPVNDTPAKLKTYGHRFTNDFNLFRLASSDAETIEKLTRQFGFFHVKKDDGSFDHIDMATVIKPDGIIYKQVYSVRSQGNLIVDRLDELITGNIKPVNSASLITKVKYFCYKYDPATGRYVIDYPMLFSSVLELLFIFGVIFAVWGRNIKAFARRRLKH